MLRFEEEPLPFSEIKNRMADTFGLDVSTCIKRIYELQKEGLVGLISESVKLRLSDLVYPTDMLRKSYDSHLSSVCSCVIETAHALGYYDVAKLINKSDFNMGSSFDRLTSIFGELWSSEMDIYLRSLFPKERAFRTRVLRSLKSFAHWHILSMAWMHGNPEYGERQPFLFADDFHMRIYPVLHLQIEATRGYVQDLIDWQLLERRYAKHGVPKNKFAVRITENTYDTIEEEAYVRGSGASK
jgi:hypothetical protein